MTTPTPPTPQAPMSVPMGFGAQIKALQESQREQAERITLLEQENATLRAFKDSTQDLLARVGALEKHNVLARTEALEQHNLPARIEAIEQHNTNLDARRREAVGQLLNLRTMHHEADNAFHVRTLDIQPDDLEGMLCVYGTSVTTVINHHQRVLAYMRKNGQLATYPVSNTPQIHQPIGPTPIRYAYPPAYTQAGYCHAHTIPYPCRMCGQ